MEWERINIKAMNELREEYGLNNWMEAKNWALEKNNFFRLGQKIISLAEKSKIFQEYTTLNENFTKRLENENRYQDEKKIGEKRPILESPSKGSDLLSPSINEDKDEEEEEEEAAEPTASPSKKNNGNNGKKKKKKKNNKK
ncbi:hypothetical protein RhiirC2_831153 [Rhizophagus irregularis]|uniref:Uncharacterized protein n=1 Tax=Rhizophagus irregularis TaxID=588596 RepID=A0A2N1N7K8_9GLOM|nr:hypothetical protein RhiirC2_831153 [Rhizophagus irregularis]